VTVPPEDPHALADAIMDLAGDPTRLAGLRLSSARAAQRFSRQVQADRMLERLQEIVGTDGARFETRNAS
jgi:glycosyltransferase involved in cell wall biosynthesis